MRHEETAALAATGYAKFTGKLGVCFATSGPGAVHMLNGLYDAKIDQAPVLAISGMADQDLIGTHYLQDMNQDYLFQDGSGARQEYYRLRVPDSARAKKCLQLAGRLGALVIKVLLGRMSFRMTAHLQRAASIRVAAGWRGPLVTRRITTTSP